LATAKNEQETQSEVPLARICIFLKKAKNKKCMVSKNLIFVCHLRKLTYKN